MTMDAPLVSVLIPVFNREKYIGACIESALSQSFRDLEVVVVDNASTDRTWDIMRRYAEADSRVRIFKNKENLGPVRNWRRCVQEARGQLGKLLFSDDLIYPDNLLLTIPYLADPNVGLVFTAVHVGEVKALETPVLYEWSGVPNVVPSRRLIEGILFDEQLPFSPGAALFRISDLRRYILCELPSPSVSGFSATGAGVDLLCYLLVANDYRLVGHVSEALGFFRSHAGSISTLAAEPVVQQYTQARILFAQCYMSRKVLLQVLTLSWLAECRRAGRLVSYRDSAGRYVTRPSTISLLSLMRIGWKRRKTLRYRVGQCFAKRL